MTELSDRHLLSRLLDAGLMFSEDLSSINAWHRHIPLAFALISLMRPRVLEDLGTHHGDSYHAFC